MKIEQIVKLGNEHCPALPDSVVRAFEARRWGKGKDGVDRPYLSSSRMNKFLSVWGCEVEDFWTYGRGRWPAMPIHVAIGQSVHSAFQHFYAERADGNYVSIEEAAMVGMHDFWRTRVNKPTDYTLGKDDDPEAIAEEVAALTTLWLTERGAQLAPISPEFVEKWFRVTMPGPFDYCGRLDMIADRVESGVEISAAWVAERDRIRAEGGDLKGVGIVCPFELIDFKTKAKRPSEHQVRNDIKMTGYALAHRELFPQFENPTLTLEIVLRQKKLAVDHMPSVRTDRDIRWFLRLFGSISRRIKTAEIAGRAAEILEKLGGDVNAEVASDLRGLSPYVAVDPGGNKCRPGSCDHYAYCRGSA